MIPRCCHGIRTVPVMLIALLIATSSGQALAEVDHEAGSAEHETRHVISLFLGATDESDFDPEFTSGLEYAYRVTPRWGVGGLVEHVGGDARNTVWGVPFSWFPHGGWVFLAGPGVEIYSGSATVPPGQDEGETNFLFKIGAAYEFEFGRSFLLAPTVNVDFVDGEHTPVYGVHFGFRF